MSTTRTVILDNEPVQALLSTGHAHHQDVLAHVQVVAQRKRRAVSVHVVVPTAVRVEAGWDRAAPAAALANQLRIRDVVLDTTATNVAAAIRTRDAVSVASAHVGAALTAASTLGPVTVITSDPNDMGKVPQSQAVTIVTL